MEYDRTKGGEETAPQSHVKAASNVTFDPSTRILRHMALYRSIIFGILVYEWNHYLPSGPVTGGHQAGGVDSWFTYDQFELFYQLTPSTLSSDHWLTAELQCQIITSIGTGLGIIAILGGIPSIVPFELAALGSIGLYLYRFLTFVHAFTNHNYLFALLATLTMISGGGCYNLSTVTFIDSRVQRCEWMALAIRLQYAVVYLFASVWKLHPDWWNGHIVKGIMLTFEAQGVARGVPWSRLYAHMPTIFVWVAVGGLVLDSGMCVALTVRRPSPESSRLFMILSALFHSFVCFTMSQRIGYSFPLSCLAGSILFQPIGSTWTKKEDDGPLIEINTVDTSLIGWIARYVHGHNARASLPQRLFTLTWLVLQLAIPLRMPYISNGTFPYTSRGYRFSWTMMLHARSTTVAHVGAAVAVDGTSLDRVVPLEFLTLWPECHGHALQRKQYMKETANPMQDPRTVPLSAILNVRHFALINVFPRHVARVAGGASNVLHHVYPYGCGTDRVAVYGVHFAKLNDHGAFHRLFDPTVDLAASDARRRARSWRQFWTDVVWDQAPGGPAYEYILQQGIGGASARVKEFEQNLPTNVVDNAKRVEFVVDRAECLHARPLALWPNGFPLAVLALEIPNDHTVYMDGRQPTAASLTNDQEAAVENQWDGLSEPQRVQLRVGQPQPVMATSLEIGLQRKTSFASNKTCRESDTEDVILALLFLA